MYKKIKPFDENNKMRIYNLLVLKGKSIRKGHLLSTHQNITEGDEYSNFFFAISNQIDPLLQYFINDEISASLEERGPLGDLIKEVKEDNNIDESSENLLYAELDLQNLFVNKTDFIIGSNMLDFIVGSYSAFEMYVSELYDTLYFHNSKSNKKEKKLISLINKYSKSTSEETKASVLEKIKKISFYVSGAEKIDYVLSKSNFPKNEKDKASKMLKYYRNQRNTIHNLGIHKGEDLSENISGIERKLEKNRPGFTTDHNSTIFACNELMDIYERMHESVMETLDPVADPSPL